MPEAHKKAEEKFKIGDYAVTNFKLDEHDNLRCKAGPLNICVDPMKRIAVGGTTKGKGEEMIYWIAEGYSKKSFLFFTGELDQISKKNFKPGDFVSKARKRHNLLYVFRVISRYGFYCNT
ncbi:hypothetical protein H0N98_02175 [Candidatus Micrarchaeota archaeon]|nr:hypothetical protein [Candidatus Micrarchaeota archaeon]